MLFILSKYWKTTVFGGFDHWKTSVWLFAILKIEEVDFINSAVNNYVPKEDF